MSHRPISWAEAKARIAATPQRDFAACFRLAGLDPAQDARFADWADVDFAGSDLAGFDFTGAKLYRAKFKGAKIVGARFDKALLDSVNHDRRTINPGDLISGPHAPAHLEGSAVLRDAEDWNAFVDPSAWRLADQPPSDSSLHPGAVFQDAPFAPEMVVVPSGSFMMGTSRQNAEEFARQGENYRQIVELEQPHREVTIAHRLAVGRFPVTFQEWDACVDDGGTRQRPDTDWGRGQQPVQSVSWVDITQDYLPWLNRRLQLSGRNSYRLLTEAEWEYCCRAGTKTAYSFGDTLNRSQASFHRNPRHTVEIGSFSSNAWGLHDMHGNVWEWCQDVFHRDYGEAPDDGSAFENSERESTLYRVIRGGSLDNPPELLRSAARSWSRPRSLNVNLGFRLARTLNP